MLQSMQIRVVCICQTKPHMSNPRTAQQLTSTVTNHAVPAHSTLDYDACLMIVTNAQWGARLQTTQNPDVVVVYGMLTTAVIMILWWVEIDQHYAPI